TEESRKGEIVMPKQNIRKLKKLIQSDKTLRQKLGTYTTGQELQSSLVKLAAQKGMAITEDELRTFITEQTAGDSDELSPEELGSLAGRFHIRPPKTATVQFGDTLIRTSRWFGITLRR